MNRGLQVTVRLFPVLRELAEKGRIVIHSDFDSIALRTILEKLADQYGDEFRSYLFSEPGRIRDHLQVLINGTSTSLLDGMNSKVQDGYEIAIIPPVTGGIRIGPYTNQQFLENH